MPEKSDPRVRLDKWLYAARFYKTRSIAAQAIEAGRARVDDQRVKPSYAVKTGARISCAQGYAGVEGGGPGRVRLNAGRRARQQGCIANRRRTRPRARKKSRDAERPSRARRVFPVARPSATGASYIRFSRETSRIAGSRSRE